jgi:hypothetical protein
VATTPAGLPLRRMPLVATGGCLRMDALPPGHYVFKCGASEPRCSILAVQPPSTPGSSRPGIATQPAPDLRVGPLLLRHLPWGMEPITLQQPVVIRQLLVAPASGIQVRRSPLWPVCSMHAGSRAAAVCPAPCM